MLILMQMALLGNSFRSLELDALSFVREKGEGRNDVYLINRGQIDIVFSIVILHQRMSAEQLSKYSGEESLRGVSYARRNPVVLKPGSGILLTISAVDDIPSMVRLPELNISVPVRRIEVQRF